MRLKTLKSLPQSFVYYDPNIIHKYLENTGWQSPFTAVGRTDPMGFAKNPSWYNPQLSTLTNTYVAAFVLTCNHVEQDAQEVMNRLISLDPYT